MMRRTCPHCSQEGQIDPCQWKGEWAYAECHACHGAYVVVRTGAPELPRRILVPEPRAPRPRLSFGWARLSLGTVVGLLIAAAPAVLLFQKFGSKITPLDVVPYSASAPTV